MIFSLCTFSCFKKFCKIEQTFSKILIPIFSLAILIIYFELESLDQRFGNEAIFCWHLGLILGFYVMTCICRMKNKKCQIFFTTFSLSYMILRISYKLDFDLTNLQRIFTLGIFICLMNGFRSEEREKKFTLKEEPKLQAKSSMKSCSLLNILKESYEEAFAIFDENCSLQLFNQKMMDFEKEENSSLLAQKLLAKKLRYVSSSVNEILETKSALKAVNFNDFFTNKPLNSLENIIEELNKIEFSDYQNNFMESRFLFEIIQSRTLEINDEKLLESKKLFLKPYYENDSKAYIIHILNQNFQNSPSPSPTTIKNNHNNKIFYVSHEMRTPLNCIISMLQILKPYLSEEVAEEYLKAAIISCNFLLYLVQDLLDMAQMESDKFTINYEEFDIRLLIADIIELFKIQANSRNATIYYNISKFVPQIIISDHRRIRQILINLIGNSLKFLKKANGQIAIEVYISSETANHICFSVKDNGIGIREEDKKNLFQAFGKINNAENQKMNSSGVGLGLMISNNLAFNLHPFKAEGLKVESSFGGGTKFSFVIEDKNEISNLNETVQIKFLNDNYQKLLKNNKDDYRFLQTKKCSENDKKKKPLNITKINEKGYSSLKVSIDRNISNCSSFYQLTPLLKSNHNINVKEYNENVKTYKKSLKNRTQKSISKLTSVENFDDIFICNKDNYESSENKMMIIKELNSLKSCDCPEILICDDNAFNLYSLRKQLESFNFRIESANDGDEAIKMVEEMFEEKKNCCQMYKIIFMDIEMPGKNGYETSIEIKNFLKSKNYEPKVRIIACSAHIREEIPNKHKECGMEEFVTKPIIKGRLVVLLSKENNIMFNFQK